MADDAREETDDDPIEVDHDSMRPNRGGPEVPREHVEHRDVESQDDVGDDEEWEELPIEQSRPRLSDTQFGLASFFLLTTMCGVYFYFEKTFHGEFGKHALGVLILVFGIVFPAIAFTFWLLRLCMSFAEPFGTILMMAVIAGAITLGMLMIWGF